MDLSIPKRTNRNPSSSNNNTSPEINTPRPHKVQKLTTSLHGFNGGILNIPEFVGPQPTTPRNTSQNQTY
jgi:hypothetical protein